MGFLYVPTTLELAVATLTEALCKQGHSFAKGSSVRNTHWLSLVLTQDSLS